MQLTILGDDPFAKDPQGHLRCRIATIFPATATLVTALPPMHALQRIAYGKFMDEQRQARGEPPLSADEKKHLRESGVDLIVDGGSLLIRPEPDDMPRAFAADALLQQLVPKTRIRFLFARDARVQQAIRERGEYWRISPVPQSPEEIARTITRSRIALGGRPIYYYNATTGTRYLTVEAFASLAELSDEELRRHLAEIQIYASRRNRRQRPEVAFFAVSPGFNHEAFAGRDVAQASPRDLRVWHADLLERFRAAVPSEFRRDQPGDLNWATHMVACLVDGPDDTMSDDALIGIPTEFFRQIRWLPGGCVENGELMFDPIFDSAERNPSDPALADLCDERVKGFICNYIREFIGLQHVNIGRISAALRRRPVAGGHRAYIAEVQHRAASTPVVRIIRIQQWGIRQHLDEGKDLLQSIMEAEDYTEYTLDRRLGCWELGMPLPGPINTLRVWETYNGLNARYRGTRIWTTCYQRDFIPGLATDKIPPDRFRDPVFALKFAELIGAAAAPSLVVGRATRDGSVIFDSGDEVLILDAHGLPQRLVVADHAGTFTDYRQPLESFAGAYARPAATRLHLVDDPGGFAETYVKALADRLAGLQADYRMRRQAFDRLFKHSKQGEGTFSWRWAQALARLDRTDVRALADRVREAIPLPP